MSDLTLDTIAELLKEQKIEGISPERVLTKLEHILVMAEVGNFRTIGKKVEMDIYGKEWSSVNLWQINWRLDGGSTQIRIYHLETKPGETKLVGIWNKKGFNKQNQYINDLLHRVAPRPAKTPEFSFNQTR